VLVPEEIVTGEPVAFSVPDRDAFDPVLTLPKFKFAGDSVNWPGALSLPDSAMLSRGLAASERIERFPVIEPVTLGVKTTPNVTLLPAPKIDGRDKLLAVNIALDILACEIVTLVVPVLVRVSFKVCEVPGGRLPKLRLVGEAEIWPAAEIPEPDTATVAVVVVEEAYPHLRWRFHVCVEALTRTEPLSVPTAGGVKVTFRSALCPGERLNGQVSPLTA
jgi:hypothetical protein